MDDHTQTDQDKIKAVLRYLREQFPECPIDFKRKADKRGRNHTWHFTVAAKEVPHTAAFDRAVWAGHTAISLYSYLKRISLAGLLRQNPGKTIESKK
jgi:hypothetical protein